MTASLTLAREDAAWLAGLLDGEGCFDSPRGNARIRVKMTDADVVLRAARLMRARVHAETTRLPGYPVVTRKPTYTAQITGTPAVLVMQEILPWLGARRTAKVTGIVIAHAAKVRARSAK